MDDIQFYVENSKYSISFARFCSFSVLQSFCVATLYLPRIKTCEVIIMLYTFNTGRPKNSFSILWYVIKLCLNMIICNIMIWSKIILLLIPNKYYDYNPKSWFCTFLWYIPIYADPPLFSCVLGSCDKRGSTYISRCPDWPTHTQWKFKNLSKSWRLSKLSKIKMENRFFRIILWVIFLLVQVMRF